MKRTKSRKPRICAPEACVATRNANCRPENVTRQTEEGASLGHRRLLTHHQYLILAAHVQNDYNRTAAKGDVKMAIRLWCPASNSGRSICLREV